MKETFTEQEQKEIRGSHHGGLKFQVFKGDERVTQCYRVTVSGGLDYCNNQVEQMVAEKDEVFTAKIFTRIGSSSRKWRQIAYLQRTKETQFNH